MNSDSHKTLFFAEVIRSSLYQWQGQCWKWDAAPAFGSLVTIRTSTETLFGIVHQVETGSIDSARTPYAYQKTEAELQRDQPHIFEFLQTSFQCLPVGYHEKSSSSMVYLVPPEPPKIHAFISHASDSEIEHFFSETAYLHLLFSLSQSISYLDELLLAMLKRQADKGILSEEKLLYFIQTFSLLTGNNYQRLKLFLQRVGFKG